ncbi:hypothetical protein B566_EDAN008661 [Ephemera danica]|nr:hypothetical protein B566_EDAN008661 [Ephemera danica]
MRSFSCCSRTTPTAGPSTGLLQAWWMLVLWWWLLSHVAIANPDAKRLYDDLLSNYNRLIRPVGNNSDRLTVKMGLRLSQLIDVVSLSLQMVMFTQTFVYVSLYTHVNHLSYWLMERLLTDNE